MLSIDFTLAIQIVNFLMLLIALNILLYKPIRGILARRQEEQSSLENCIEAFQTRSDRNEKSIEEGNLQARKEGFSEKEALKNSGHEKETGVLQNAISAAEEKVGNARKDIDAKVADVRKTLEEQIVLFSNDLAEKILGRSI